MRFALDEPLSTPGSYEVRYEVVSFDTDPTDGAYEFTYAPEAPAARRIGVVEPVGTNWPRVAALVVFLVAVVAAGFLVLSRVERRRRAAVAGADGTTSEP